MRASEPHRRASARSAEACPRDDQPAAHVGRIGRASQRGSRGSKLITPTGPCIAGERGGNRRGDPRRIAASALDFEQERHPAGNQVEQLAQASGYARRCRTAAEPARIRPASIRPPVREAHSRRRSWSWKTMTWSSADRRTSHSMPAPARARRAKAARLFSGTPGAVEPAMREPHRPGIERIRRGPGRPHPPRPRRRAGGPERRPPSGHGARPRRTRPASAPTRHWRPWAGR